MSWLLDTDTCSLATRDQSGVASAILACASSRVHVCAITVAEAWAGALRKPNHRQLVELWTAFLEPFRDRILPFDDAAGREYGAIRAHLEGAGTMIGDRDCMIAAVARSNRLTLVTGNRREFERVPHLKLDDWAR